MILNKKGILFHHFHSNKNFYKSPGSLTKNKFHKFIKKNRKFIKNPEEFLFSSNKEKIMTLTFDDGLKCQFDIALEVLENFNLKGFFFIFTSPYCNDHFTIENIRYFRYKYFHSSREFYLSFYNKYEKVSGQKINFNNKKNKNLFKIYRKSSPYYTTDDINYKIARDNILDKKTYNKVILLMLEEKKVNLRNLTKKLYMSKDDIKKIYKMGHTIGLHSHSHNYLNYKFSYLEEKKDYLLNKEILEKIVSGNVNCSSYPFGNYTKNSSQIFDEIEIDYAFCKNLNQSFNKKVNHFIPRENISNLII